MAIARVMLNFKGGAIPLDQVFTLQCVLCGTTAEIHGAALAEQVTLPDCGCFPVGNWSCTGGSEGYENITVMTMAAFVDYGDGEIGHVRIGLPPSVGQP